MAKHDKDPIEKTEGDDLFRSLINYADVFLAVSGGADSTALMHLVAGWRASRSDGPRVAVLTVDHGLRPEAAREAQAVAAQAAELGLPATVLTWHGDKPVSGVQAAARDARYGLMFAHVREAAADPRRAALVTAHHRDDLAETFLMRLARGAGVDGLASILPVTRREDISILRPLLNVPKSRLLASLAVFGSSWVEDPSNADPHFERSRLRTSLPAARQLGLDGAHLALSARRLARARRALEAQVDTWLTPRLTSPLLSAAGVFVWPWRQEALADEIAIRILLRVLPAVGGVAEPVRLMRAERLWDDMQRDDFAGATLANCIVSPAEQAGVMIFREPRRATLPTIETDLGRPLSWDNRFEIAIRCGQIAGCRVRPLTSQDLALFNVDTSSRALPCPLEALLATPVIDDPAGPCAIPALNLHRRGPNAPANRLSCRFMTERFETRVGGSV
ncbi:MAG: tRNA lysidine(34) synthetase TilS, partial [Hyphomicrobiaceae bacterium]